MMKKNCAFALILIVVLCSTLCACDGAKTSPWGEQNTENKDGTPKPFTLYVCGAVKNEGYYEAKEGETYLDVITKAGRLDESDLLSKYFELVDGETTAICVGYLEDGVAHSCVDVNSDFFLLRDATLFYGLSQEVVNKIADYREAHGTVTNQQILREVLGDDYENYHYKLYVAEANYEAVD